MSTRDHARMTPDEALQVLDTLGLTMDQAARLLRISTRTMRRYFEDADGEEGEGGSIPGPVEQALRAWIALNERGLPWRWDAHPLNAVEPTQLARIAMQRQQVRECIQRVHERKGPTLPWEVDAAHGVAKLGSMSLYFYVVPGGGFVPQGYTRQDKVPDLDRDQAMLEDGIATIAQWLQDVDQAAEPAPMLTKPTHSAGFYFLWEDRTPPRYVVRIPEADVAQLAETADEGACLRFLQATHGDIAKIADVDFHLKGKRVPGLDIYVLGLDAQALAPAGVAYRRGLDEIDVLVQRTRAAGARTPTKRVTLVGASHHGIPPILGEG